MQVVNVNALFRDENLEKQHTIPIGTLVEVDCDYSDEHMTRQYVVGHSRDCDGTPLYDLSVYKSIIETIENGGVQSILIPEDLAIQTLARGTFLGKISKNWSCDALIIIKPPG